MLLNSKAGKNSPTVSEPCSLVYVRLYQSDPFTNDEADVVARVAMPFGAAADLVRRLSSLLES